MAGAGGVAMTAAGTIGLVVLDETGAGRRDCVAKRCDRAAAWWFEHTCGMPTFVCGYHRDVLEERNASRGMKCKQCGRPPQNPIPWNPT